MTEKSGLPYFSLVQPPGTQERLIKVKKDSMIGRLALYLISAIVVIAMILIMFLQRKTLCESKAYQYTTLSFFLTTGLACLIMLTLLIHTIRRTFTDELNREMKQLIVSQSIFVAIFILRGGFIIILAFNLWIDFTRDYPSKMTNGFLTAMFPLQFIYYNFIPYLTLMLLHRKNYKKSSQDEHPR